MSSESWQDHIPETLIGELEATDEYVQFTDDWRELDVEQQVDVARHWLRRALGLELWR